VGRFWETYRRATDLRIAGQPAEAAAAYAEALTLVPEHQDALYYLGSMDFELGDLPGAEQAWRRLVAVDPSNARGHSRLGTLYSCIGAPALLDLARASAEFERALAINREETGPLLQLGEIALLRDDPAGARSWFEKVVGSHVSSVEAHFYLGYLAWQEGASDRAAELLAAAVRHAQPTEPPKGVLGEGDTRAGTGPLIAHPDRCRPMRATASDLAGLDADAVAGRGGTIYRELGAVLEDVRRSLPR
jgi:tetratricopeptide (TPR) repeat protein